MKYQVRISIKEHKNSRKRKHRQVNIIGTNQRPKTQQIHKDTGSKYINSLDNFKQLRNIQSNGETNHLMAQQQIAQQRALQALLLYQEQSNENEEIAKRVQTQALKALTDATEQRV